jgi:hypothetical protein
MMHHARMLPSLLAATLALPMTGPAAEPLDLVAERYVKLVLAVGRHAPEYVDAYFGQPEWQAEAERAGKRPLSDLAAEADRLLGAAKAAHVPPGDGDRALRRDFLAGQLSALRAYLEMVGGKRLSFDDEARALYGVAPPRRDLASFETIQARLDALLPGSGAIPARYQAWKKRLVVPRSRIEAVMHAAIEEVRKRTLSRLELPPGERFGLSLVSGKPWAAYNWYRGRAESLIELNTDLPTYAFAVVGLAAHEGYPGHHVLNALQEARLARERHQVEHLVYPLFSPVSLIAEGSAEAGVELVFPEADRLAFERDVLFPMAGLDPAEAPGSARIRKLVRGLRPSGPELARRYLDGSMTADQVRRWEVAYGLKTPEEAAKSVQFMDAYRSYGINYSYGEEVVTAWLDARAGPDAATRWAAFVDLLGSPRLPAALLARPAR